MPAPLGAPLTTRLVACGAETLETLGRVEYRDSIHGMVKTAHPHRMPSGDIIGMAADFGPFLDTSATPSRLVGCGAGGARC